MMDRFAWGVTWDAVDQDVDLTENRSVEVYRGHGNPEVIANAIEAIHQWAESGQRIAATSEDTEPVGKDVGFLQEPKKELYPCLFQGTKDIPSDTIATLKNHVVEPLSERFTNPDAWIMFSIYGSGISYN